MSKPAIIVENLGKQYKIGLREKADRTFREAIVDTLAAPFRRLRTLGEKSVGDDTIWALRGVSLEVQPGEVVGIIGPNGAGKTTLLKILSRITEPTEGQVRLRGRVGSLLEVGTGFHRELTGRENVYLNGAILGMGKAEINRKFDEIVDFAGVEKFIDTPIKRYSSGMYVRLAFAVAAHLEPEILLVDEVLAVGDAEFQKRCLGKMDEVAKGGRTVLFVSHNMGSITRLCSRAIMLDQGQIAAVGASAEVVAVYMGKDERQGIGVDFSRRRAESDLIRIADAWLEREGVRSTKFVFGEEPAVIIAIQIAEPISFSVELLLRDQQGMPVAFAPGGLSQDGEYFARPGEAFVRCRLPALRLAQGKYSLDLMLAKANIRFFDCLESALSFSILEMPIGKQNWPFRQSRGQGCLLWDVRYEFDG